MSEIYFKESVNSLVLSRHVLSYKYTKARNFFNENLELVISITKNIKLKPMDNIFVGETGEDDKVFSVSQITYNNDTATVVCDPAGLRFFNHYDSIVRAGYNDLNYHLSRIKTDLRVNNINFIDNRVEKTSAHTSYTAPANLKTRLGDLCASYDMTARQKVSYDNDGNYYIDIIFENDTNFIDNHRIIHERELPKGYYKKTVDAQDYANAIRAFYNQGANSVFVFIRNGRVFETGELRAGDVVKKISVNADSANLATALAIKEAKKSFVKTSIDLKLPGYDIKPKELITFIDDSGEKSRVVADRIIIPSDGTPEVETISI